MLDAILQADLELSARVLAALDDHPRLIVALRRIADSNELKGLIPALFIWYFWFRTDRDGHTRRNEVLAVSLSATLAIFAGIIAPQVLPFRVRPMFNPEVVGPDIRTGEYLESWSSMPSDHAVMFFALAAGFFYVSRTAGILASIQAILIVSLPRFLVGYHYALDLFVGAIIGVLVALLTLPAITWMLERTAFISRAKEWYLYPFLFLITFSFATMFNSARALAIILVEVAEGMF